MKQITVISIVYYLNVNKSSTSNTTAVKNNTQRDVYKYRLQAYSLKCSYCWLNHVADVDIFSSISLLLNSVDLSVGLCPSEFIMLF